MSSHRSSTSKPRGLVVHRPVALLVCDDPALLEEVLQGVDMSALHYERVGLRGVILPQYDAVRLQAALLARGVHARQMGPPLEGFQERHVEGSLEELSEEGEQG